jgi:adenine-specific DNA-methyltransferase
MDGKSLDVIKEKIKQLQQIFPEIFPEGKIDFEKLKLALGEKMAPQNERYALTWAGKSDAFRVIQEQTTATLVPARDESIDFDVTKNVFIEGENLEVLKVLQKPYFGKIKLIYIDPPYNTGNDHFVYPDNFAERRTEYLKRVNDIDDNGYLNKEDLFRKNVKESGQFHSNWLGMMYPRLYLARNLLREDGVIFVSIDDNEVHNLRLLMDEVFGEENFVGSVVWKKKHAYGRGHTFIIPQTEYILCYANNSDAANSFGISYAEEKTKEFKYEDEKGKYRLLRLWFTAPRGAYIRPTLQYQLYTPDGRPVDSVTGQWLWNETRMQSEIAQNNVVFVEQNDGTIRAFKKDYLASHEAEKPTSLYDKATTDDATREFNTLLPEVKESMFTKPSKLIFDLISWVTLLEPNEEHIILDFFVGSGTTAQAVLELNKSDGGNRKFICVQLPEKTDENSEAYKAGYQTVAEIGKERIRRVIQKIKEEASHELPFQESIDLGFKVFKLNPSNFKLWRGDIQTEAELTRQLEAFIDPVKAHAEEEHQLWELLIKAGKPLTVSIETKEIEDIPVYVIDDADLVITLRGISQKIIDEVRTLKPKAFLCLDRLFHNDDQLKTNTALQMQDAGIEFTAI